MHRLSNDQFQDAMGALVAAGNALRARGGDDALVARLCDKEIDRMRALGPEKIEEEDFYSIMASMVAASRTLQNEDDPENLVAIPVEQQIRVMYDVARGMYENETGN